MAGRERSGCIRPLPPEVVAQIKSSTSITSLSGVVLELVKNAIDAGAQGIKVTVDFIRGGCIVEDDGVGILCQDFCEGGGLGKLYHTSKLQVPPPTTLHGHKGSFLASLASMCLLRVTSRHREEDSPSAIVFHHTRPLMRLTPALDHAQLHHFEVGTQVTVTDLFGNMPVRVKQRALSAGEHNNNEREWNEIKRKLVGVLLAWHHPVTLAIEADGGKRKWMVRPISITSTRKLRTDRASGVQTAYRFDLSHIASIFSQAGYILPSGIDSWVEASATAPLLSICSAISLQPAPTKQTQFISMGISPILSQHDNSILYDEINQIFSSSSFGFVEGDRDHDEKGLYGPQKDRSLHVKGKATGHLGSGRKGVNRWPMFYIRIDLQSPVPNEFDNQGFSAREASLQTISQVLRAMILQFLKEHHFQPQTSRSRNGADLDESHVDRPSLTPRESGGPRAFPSTEVGVENFMNTTVKLPDFSRRTPKPLDTVFGAWNRIKSARKGALEGIYNGSFQKKVSVQQDQSMPILTENLLSRRGSEDRPHGNVEGSTSKQTNVYTNSTWDSFSKSGCATPNSESATATLPTSLKDTSFIELDNQDDLIPWKDPSTQTTVLINSRTGHVVPADVTRTLCDGTSCGASRPSSSASVISSTRRLRNSRSNSSLPITPRPTSWLGDMLKEWDNPVFRQTEAPVTSLHLDEQESLKKLEGTIRRRGSLKDLRDVFETNVPVFSGQLSKESLSEAEIVSQVDRKFILAKVPVLVTGEPLGCLNPSRNVLILIDQHAADERCRIEDLFAELWSSAARAQISNSDAEISDSSVSITVLGSPLRFRIPIQESRLFVENQRFLQDWGFNYSINNQQLKSMSSTAQETELTVTALPSLIAERCRLEPKLLIELLRTEVWAREESGPRAKLSSSAFPRTSISATGARDSLVDVEIPPTTNSHKHRWLRRIGTCPKGMLDMLISRSCRTAIMFNDPLTLEECEKLVSRLARCAFPFQCAHGRPTMAPLLELATSYDDDDTNLVSTLLTNRLALRNADRKVGSLPGSFAEEFQKWNQTADAV